MGWLSRFFDWAFGAAKAAAPLLEATAKAAAVAAVRAELAKHRVNLPGNAVYAVQVLLGQVEAGADYSVDLESAVAEVRRARLDSTAKAALLAALEVLKGRAGK